MSIRQTLIATLALLLLAPAATGCSRCSRAERQALETGKQPAVESTAAVEGAPAPVPAPADVHKDAGPPADVLVVAPAPLHNAQACDEALRPIATALRASPEVEQVWTRSSPGVVRMVVRFARGLTQQAAHKRVQTAWKADAAAWFGKPLMAANVRGARAVLAYTLVSPKGRQEATKLANGALRRAAKALPGASGTGIAGAVRPYTMVQVDPVALSNHGITYARFRAALDEVMADEGVRSVAKRLSDTTIKRAGPGVAGLPPASLDRLTIQTSGIGEPLREAQVGRNMVTTLLVESGHGVDLRDLFQGDSKHLRDLARKLEADGVQVVSHNLSTATRFVLTRANARPPGPRSELGDRIVRLLKDGGIYDALLVDGVDGIPTELDRGRPGARTRTLWLLLGNHARDEEVFNRVQTTMAEAGWQAHLMHEAADIALMWLVNRFGTAGMVVSSRDPGELAAPTRVVGEVARQARSAGLLQTGPRLAPPPRPFATIDRQAAQERGIRDADIAQVHDLADGPRPLAQVVGEPVWLSLPTETMAGHVAKLPLRVGKSATVWSDLQRLPTDDAQIDRLRAGGEPALWLVVDSTIEEPGNFTDGFWQSVERLVEPTPTLHLRPLRLNHQLLGGQP